MDNNLLRIKFTQRLNKQTSQDYDNLDCWAIAEAFNKAQLEWVRRQLHGMNPKKLGDEQSTARIDDLQVLLQSLDLKGSNQKLFFESLSLPPDYLGFKRVSAPAKTTACPERTLTVYLAEEADTDLLLVDKFKEPDFSWAETFCTLFGNAVRIYTDDKFEIVNPRLIYYRKPRPVKFPGCIDPSTGAVTDDQTSELKDDVVELIIDEAVSIMAGDLEQASQFQRNSQNAERNN